MTKGKFSNTDRILAYIGNFLEKLNSEEPTLTVEQKLIELLIRFNTTCEKVVIAPAIVENQLIITIYDRFTAKLVTRVTADRAIEEFHAQAITPKLIVEILNTPHR